MYSSDEQNNHLLQKICLFISFFEFAVEWIPAIRNKAEIICDMIKHELRVESSKYELKA